VLALAAIRRELERAAVGEVEGFVAVEHRLDEIITGRHRCDRPRGPAERGRIERARRASGPAVDIHSEHLRRIEQFVGADMAARLAREIARQQQDDPAVHRRGDGGWRQGEADGERVRSLRSPADAREASEQGQQCGNPSFHRRSTLTRHDARHSAARQA